MSGPGDGGARTDRALLTAAVLALALTAVVAVPVATALAGRAGALGAAAALAFLVVLLGLSAVLHVLAAPYGRQVWLGLTLGGLVVRVGLYAALVLVLAGVEGLDPTALGLTAAFGIVAGQAFEMRALARVRAQATGGGPTAAAAPAAGSRGGGNESPPDGRNELQGVDR